MFLFIRDINNKNDSDLWYIYVELPLQAWVEVYSEVKWREIINEIPFI